MRIVISAVKAEIGGIVSDGRKAARADWRSASAAIKSSVYIKKDFWRLKNRWTMVDNQSYKIDYNIKYLYGPLAVSSFYAQLVPALGNGSRVNSYEYHFFADLFHLRFFSTIFRYRIA